MGRVCVLLMVSACFHPHYDQPACGPGDECPGALVCMQGFCTSPGDGASTDASLPGPPSDGCATFSRQLDTCTLSLTMDLDVSGAAIYNTDTHELRVTDQVVPVARATIDVQGTAADAILAHDVTLRSGALLRAVGNQPAGALPLAIVASGNVTLEDGASIDVSEGGAGALSVCSTPPGAGTDSNNEGGGGGGGAGHGAAGGDGGDGNGNGPRVPGGSGAPSVALFGLRGGCSGARGGMGEGSAVGEGGRGGGAIFIAAAGTITLAPNALLHAGGGGGRGPSPGEAGGGGGGSGGLIFLEAPHVLAASASIAANGGGGGQGSGRTSSGNPGAPGSTTTSRAPGGSGPGTGARGGQGGARDVPSGENVTIVQTGGGGGGGGGVGYVRVASPDAQLSASVSPSPILEP